MKWTLGELSVDDNQRMYYEQSVKLNKTDFKHIDRLIDIDTFYINGVWYYDELNDHLYTEFNLSGDITVAGSVDLEPYVHHIDVNTMEVFGFDEVDDIADHLVQNEEVDIMPFIKQLVVANIPVKMVDENLEYPKGDGWIVISEDEFNNEEKPINPKMAKLLELKLEDD